MLAHNYAPCYYLFKKVFIFEYVHSEFDRVWVDITLKKYHDDLKQPDEQGRAKGVTHHHAN